MITQEREQQRMDRWIERPLLAADPAEAQLVYYGTPVWSLVAYLDAVNHDPARVAEDYGVPLDAVEAALTYYREHHGVIDARIAANAV